MEINETRTMIAVIIYATLFASIVVAKAIHDNSMIRLRDKESKEDQLKVHGAGAYLIAFCLFCLTFTGLNWESLENFFFLASLFWLFFDYTLNIFRGKPLLYVGYTDVIDKSIRHVSLKIKTKPETTGLLLKALTVSISAWI
jgi:hypothetical protein